MRAEFRSADDAANAFLQQLLADRAAGRVRSLGDYQALYPGHAETVRREYESVVEAPSHQGADRAGLPATDFARTFRDDLRCGQVRTLGEYTTLFPGHELEIAEALAVAAVDAARQPTLELAAGSSVGPYHLVRELGRGGQGVVYLARDTRLGRTVALKLLTGLGAARPERLERFRREASIASRLHHPGICTVYEWDSHDGVPYVVMRHLEGHTLAEHLDKRSGTKAAASASDTAQSIAWIEQGARALHAAHEAGVVHRDIKPGNLMVTSDGQVVLMDFGLAHMEEEGDSLTGPGDTLGTPAYMSPEQIGSASGGRPRVEGRTDIYSLGVCLYECLTGHRPFRAPTRTGLLNAILTGAVPDPRRTAPQVTSDLAIVVLTAIARDPDDRYQTALDLAEDLRAVAESRTIAARPLPWWKRAQRWVAREPAQALLAGGLVLALTTAAGFGGYLIRQRPVLRAGEEQIERAELARELDTSLQSGRAAMSEYLAVDAENTRARAVAAVSRLVTREPEETLRLVDEAPETSPESVALQRLRAAALRALGRTEAAVALEAELPQEPTGEIDSYVTAHLLHTGGRSAEALRFASRAVRLSDEPHFPYFTLLAEAAIRCGESDTARDAIDVLTLRWPDHKLTQLCLGEFHLLPPPDYARAAEAYTRAAEMDPEHTLAHAGSAWALIGLGELERGQTYRNRALELFGDNVDGRYHFLVALGIVHCDSGRLQAGMGEYEAALELDPDRAPAHYHMGRALLALGQPELAHDSLARALELAPEHDAARALQEQVKQTLAHTASE